MEVYHYHKRYSCNEIDHLSFFISLISNNQTYKPPSDSHPVHVQQNKFTINVNSQLATPSKSQPSSFTDYCNHLQVWKHQLLKHVFTEYRDSFVTIIKERTPINIANDGTKSSMKSGGGWIITSSAGKILAHGANPDLGSMENMHSHCSEAYAVLSAFLFIAQYSKYFSLQFNNQCTLYCDNKEIVKKIKKFSTTTNHFQPYYKMSEHEAIIAIQHHLPSRINLIHFYSHQDKVKGKDKLTSPEKLNNLADSIADNYARSPINNHIPLTPLAVYFNHHYIPNNY